MRISAAVILCGFLGSNAFARCDRPGAVPLPPAPVAYSVPAPSPTVVTVPATIIQKRVEYRPVTKTVMVEQLVTTYEPVIIEEEVQVVDVQECCNEQVQYQPQPDYSMPQPQYRTQGPTDKMMAIWFAQRAVSDMEREEERPRKIRRARRELARMERHIEDEPTRGGY